MTHTENRDQFEWYRNPRSNVFHAYRKDDEDTMSLCGRARLDHKAFVEVLGENVGRRCSYCPWTDEFMRAAMADSDQPDPDAPKWPDYEWALDAVALIIDKHVTWDERYGLDGQYEAAKEILARLTRVIHLFGREKDGQAPLQR